MKRNLDKIKRKIFRTPINNLMPKQKGLCSPKLKVTVLTINENPTEFIGTKRGFRSPAQTK